MFARSINILYSASIVCMLMITVTVGEEDSTGSYAHNLFIVLDCPIDTSSVIVVECALKLGLEFLFMTVLQHSA